MAAKQGDNVDEALKGVNAIIAQYEELKRKKLVVNKPYWSDFEPELVRDETGTIISVKLKCGLCGKLLTASNPS
jgi:hypothetical protein